MSSYIDTKFVNLLSNRLPKFKQKSDYLWNFRCPHCGDSQKSSTKARGFIYQKKNDLFYKCHNCGIGQSLGNLIKFLDPNMHKEYVLEKYKSGRIKDEPEFDFTPTKTLASTTHYDKTLSQLKKFNELVITHPAKKFVYDRLIPKVHWDKLYFCHNFYRWTNDIIPNKFSDLKYDHPRVVIPFFDRAGKFFAYQGRAFGKERPKYITIKFDETKEKIYGLDRINLNKPVMITEGPIDSLFLDNAIAFAGADAVVNIQHEQCTMIFDNEPRNEQIVNRMISAVDKKFNLVVFPESLKYKDINDMVIAGLTADEITTLIHSNTYCGLTAFQHINNWKRI